MKYKLIALDLDGTLTDSNKLVLPKTAAVLKRLAQKGVIITLASGRPTPGMHYVADTVELEKGGYVLSFNGAKIINWQTKEVVYQKTYDKSIGHQVIDRAHEYNLCPISYSDKAILTQTPEDEYTIEEGRINNMELLKVADLKSVLEDNVDKLLLTGDGDYLAKIVDEFKAPFDGQLAIYRSQPFFIEVMAQGIDKAQSLDSLIKELNIKQEEVIAFGDGYNDLSMIEFAGLGVAMANACDEVKQKADRITLSNDEDGIAHVLEQLELNGAF